MISRYWNWGNLPWSHSSLQALEKKDSGPPGSKWCCKDSVQHKDHAGSLDRNVVEREGRKKTSYSPHKKLMQSARASKCAGRNRGLSHCSHAPLQVPARSQCSTQDRSRQAPNPSPYSYFCIPGALLPTSNHKYLQLHMTRACRNSVRREKQKRKGKGGKGKGKVQ